MTSTSFAHGQDEPEQIVVRFRRHGRVLLGPVLALLIGAALAGWFVGSFAAAWANVLVLLGVLLLVVAGFVGPFFVWFSGRTTVTTRRVIVRSGVFTRSRSEVSIAQVRTVASQRNFVQRFVGAGDIELAVSADDALRLVDVPGVEDIAAVLQQLVEAAHGARRQQTGYFTPAPGQQTAPGAASESAAGLSQRSVHGADNGGFVARRRM